MELEQIISEIQTSQCCNCKYGKALIALKGLDKPELPAEASEAPASGNGKGLNTRAAISRKEKTCHGCGVVKPLAAYPVNKGCVGGHSGTCKGCIRERAKARRHAKKAASNSRTVPESEPQEPAGELICQLCHARASSPKRLASHMRVVHSASAG